MKRRTLSKRKRFAVLQRDGFKCRYCGNGPPNTMVEVDHVKPVALGGTNNFNNLVTACADCNAGKSDSPIDPDVMDRLLDYWLEVDAMYDKMLADFNGFPIIRPSREEVIHFFRILLRSNVDSGSIDYAIRHAKFMLKNGDTWEVHGFHPWAYCVGICWSRVKHAQFQKTHGGHVNA